jgi:hypothetical protein
MSSGKEGSPHKETASSSKEHPPRSDKPFVNATDLQSNGWNLFQPREDSLGELFVDAVDSR